jgi:predicted extracellular nuclease
MKKTGLKKAELIKPCLLALTCSISAASHAAVIINEIDYDQVGTDTAEFIELFNTGTSTVSLDNFSIMLINGTNSSSYRNIDLSGFNIAADGFFVICSDTTAVANCNYSFTTSDSWLQNGSPDAVGLYESDSLIDSLSYEGALLVFTEGSVLTLSDNNVDIVSLSRISNGFDSNDNAADFQLGCITPGSSNIAGTGNCSTTAVSAVPVPAAAWLFGSGIIGLVGMARRK